MLIQAQQFEADLEEASGRFLLQPTLWHPNARNQAGGLARGHE